MPEPVAPAAPSAAPAAAKPATPAPKPPAPNGAPSAVAKAPKPAPVGDDSPAAPEADDWNDETDKPTLEKLLKKYSKKDPRARVKVRGEEKGVESLDDFLGVITDAQRGRGANKVVEEAKAQAAKAQKVIELRERAAAGDPEALQELAGPQIFQQLEAFRKQQAEEQNLMAQMSEPEKLLFSELQQARALIAQREQADAQAQQQREQHAHEQRIANVKAEAKEVARSIIAGLNLPPEKMDVVGPFAIRAMREATELGLELGKDVPPEAIMRRAQEEMTGVVNNVIGGLKPAQLADFLGPDRLRELATEYMNRRRGAGGRPAPEGPLASKKQPEPSAEIGTPGYLLRGW